MKGNSSQQKGKRFERWIAKEIQNFGLGKAAREIGSGQGSFKGDIRANIPFLLEAKNVKTLPIWKSIDQARRQARQGNWDANKWALIVRDPRTPEEKTEAYAVIDFYEFLALLKKDKEPMVKEPDREMKYKLQNAITALKALEKYLP